MQNFLDVAGDVGEFYSELFESAHSRGVHVVNFGLRAGARLLEDSSTDDTATDGSAGDEMEQIESTVYANIVMFFLLMFFFEAFRRIQRIYLCRRTVGKVQKKRVPQSPVGMPGSWLSIIHPVSDDEFLRMAGLDAYMMMRFIKVCIRVTALYTMCGLAILAPVYYTGLAGHDKEWERYTIANVKPDPAAARLWAPVAAAYVFAAFFCSSFSAEYRHFLERRVEYFDEGGDPDTPLQTYYTVMIDQIPEALRNKMALQTFFDGILPGQVFSVEMTYDLTDMDRTSKERQRARENLENAIAQWRGMALQSHNGNEARPMTTQYPAWMGFPRQTAVKYVQTDVCCGLAQVEQFDTIDYWAAELTRLNEEVVRMQTDYYSGKAVTDTGTGAGLLDNIEESFVRSLIALKLPSKMLDKKFRAFQSVLARTDEHKLRQSMNSISSNDGFGGGLGPSIDEGEEEEDGDKSAKMSAGAEEEGLTESLLKNQQHFSAAAPAVIAPEPTAAAAASASRNGGKGKPGGGGIIGNMEISASSSLPASLDSGSSGSGDRDKSDSPLHLAADDSGSGAETESPLSKGDAGIFKDVATPAKPTKRAPQIDSHLGSHSGHSGKPLAPGVPTAAAGCGGSSAADEDGNSSSNGTFVFARKFVGNIGTVLNEGGKVGGHAIGGVLRGIHTGLHGLELLTLGSYKTSSTAFVTFKSRVACSMAYQMFLSTDHYSMRISPAPQPGDVQWRNVAKSQNQVETRKSVADAAFYVGALFWSVLVSGIAAISNLDNLAMKYPWIKNYQDTRFYSILNSYLASLLLIVVLALLPFIFDFSARWYEGIKLESRIQESIMTRFFFYQLVNVFVSVGLGSILTNLASILEKPEQIFTILGVAVPSFSVYFTNLIIVKTFTAVPLEMLRPWPLIQVLSLGSIINEKTCSWRYLHTGIFAAPEMLYSWYYPSLLMVLMIINIYACISPLLLPFALVYFIFVFYMYKYQLLYIFQNKYQAGGMMWVRVFRYSMMSLIMGTSTVVCYFAILRSFMTGPFYVLIPLPVLIYYYWKQCEAAYLGPIQQMSLESSVARDTEHEEYQKRKAAGAKKPRYRRVSTAVKFDATKGTFTRTLNPIDESLLNGNDYSEEIPIESFQESLFQQPSLKEGVLEPLPYRQINDKMAFQASSVNIERKHAHHRSSLEDYDDTVKQKPVHRGGALAPSPASSVLLPKQEAEESSSSSSSSSEPGEPGDFVKSTQSVSRSVKEYTTERYEIKESFFSYTQGTGDGGALEDIDEGGPDGTEEDFTSSGRWTPYSWAGAEEDEDEARDQV